MDRIAVSSLIPMFTLFRLLVVVSPVMQPSVLEEDQEDSPPPGPDLNMSWDKSYFQQTETEPSPFSSKKVMYESEQVSVVTMSS